MKTLEYQCPMCDKRIEETSSVHTTTVQPFCPDCDEPMEWTPTVVPLGRFKFDPSKAGKDTGVYDYDYGTRATWDLTVPGKMKKLEKIGRIPRDPFDEHEEKVQKGEIPRYEAPLPPGPDPLEN